MRGIAHCCMKCTNRGEFHIAFYLPEKQGQQITKEKWPILNEKIHQIKNFHHLLTVVWNLLSFLTWLLEVKR